MNYLVFCYFGSATPLLPFTGINTQKRRLLFHKSVSDKWHSSGCQPNTGSQPALCPLVCGYFSLPQLSACFRPKPSLRRGTKERSQWKSFCVLLISLFRVNENASFCTNKSLQEFYWISKTKMFLCTPCPHFTSAWEVKLSKILGTMTSRFPSFSNVLQFYWVVGFELYLNFLWWNPEPLFSFR
jgi:hypothetical protein